MAALVPVTIGKDWTWPKLLIRASIDRSVPNRVAPPKTCDRKENHRHD